MLSWEVAEILGHLERLNYPSKLMYCVNIWLKSSFLKDLAAYLGDKHNLRTRNTTKKKNICSEKCTNSSKFIIPILKF